VVPVSAGTVGAGAVGVLDGGVGALVDGVSGAVGLGAAVLGPEVHVGACVVAGAGVVDGCASAVVRTARPTRSSVSSPPSLH